MTMDARKQRVLQAIVALYGLEGEPVGSSVLANYFDMAVSSATLRNEMAALTKLGLLEQPHTSAGRVPSAKGYRYYLDNLLTDDQPLDRVTRARVDAVFASLDHEPEKLAQGAAKALAALVDKYSVRDVLSAFMLRCYGFDGPLYERDSLLMLASHVLLTAASTALPEGALKGLESYVAPAYGPYCLEAVRTWDQAADAQASSEDLFEICRLVEDARGLFARFEALPIDVLASLDVFPCVNEAVLSQLFCSFAQGADRVEDARTFAARRCDLSWYRRATLTCLPLWPICAHLGRHTLAGSIWRNPSRYGMPTRPIGMPWTLPIVICAPRICGRAPPSAMCSRSLPELWWTGRRISTATGSWPTPMPAGRPLRKGSGPIAATSMALHGRMSSTGMYCLPLWALPKR